MPGRGSSTTHLALAAALATLAPATGSKAGELWPAAVHARYRLKFQGIPVGHIDFASKVGGESYALQSTGEVSLMFGLLKWVGSSSAEGRVEAAAIAPKSYAFDWAKNKKGGAVRMAFAGRKATDVKVEPPPKTGPEIVPLTDAHKSGILDPLSAIMSLTRAGGNNPCERRVSVFDGKQRFDIVFTFKRKTTIETAGHAPSAAVVCRAMYEPIAGYKNDVHAKDYAANRDAEVILRRVSGTELLIPHSVTIPTSWGTGTMVIDRVDVTSATAGQFALTE